MDLGGVSGVLYGRWGAMPLTATEEEVRTADWRRRGGKLD